MVTERQQNILNLIIDVYKRQVYMQTKLFQVQSDLTRVNAQIEEKKTELDDAKQEVNELIRSERLTGIANSQDLQLNNENIRSAE